MDGQTGGAYAAAAGVGEAKKAAEWVSLSPSLVPLLR